MPCTHFHPPYSTHGLDRATTLGHTTGQALGLTFHLVGAGARLFQHFMHGLIWQEHWRPDGCACAMGHRCGPVVHHHYCVQCRPSPCPCHPCC